MSSFSGVPLGELMASGTGSVNPADYPDETFDLYSIPAFDSRAPEVVRGSKVRSSKQVVQPNDVLLSKIVPHIRRSWVVGQECNRRLIASGEWIVFRSDRIHPPYLRQMLISDHFHAQFMSTVAGIGGSLLRARPAHVANLQIPLPSLAEQRRIAEALDCAEALRAKRQSAINHLDMLTHSIFLDMFGDAKRNDRSWPTVRLQELLAMPLRNGVSPSYGASTQAIVLTLSAITGGAFNASAQKVGTFHNKVAKAQLVDQRDLLICRGNGNIQLVGKGHFPLGPMPDVIFPDTMIAARVAPERAEPAFLEHVWNSDSVRVQLERLARTTNGTFKVNQTMLEGVSVIAPPLTLQSDFANRYSAIEVIRARHLASSKEMDALVASLQHRAFRGEL